MKLFYSPGACSLSPHIVAREAGLDVQLVLVPRDKKLPDGSDYRDLVPAGYVPALQLDDGSMMTEGQVIVQYLADLAPQKHLMPAAGTIERYRAQEWLGFIATELHKSFSPLYSPQCPDTWKQAMKDRIVSRLEIVDAKLGGNKFLLGDTFTAPDAYLYVMLRWARALNLDIAKLSNLAGYFDRVTDRPGVSAALAAEKLKS